tara:strand:- start:495 stop:707 length:213 start_codon:yes stop_codon:yes gene_type:complete
MIYRLLTAFILTGCAAYVPETKEWNDKYDPADWRKQFEECRDKFYVHYPDEVNPNDWHKCMERDYELKES